MDYIDTVLNENGEALFHGTNDETFKWLLSHPKWVIETYRVDRGEYQKTVEVPNYLDDVRFARVLELVRAAIEIGDPNATACEIAREIVKLYE